MTQELAHLWQIDARLEFYHYLTDALCLHTGNGGFVGTEHPCCQDGAKARGKLDGCRLDSALVAVAQVDIDEAREGRIVKHATLFGEIANEAFEVVAHYLAYHGQVFVLRLQHDEAAFAFAPCSTTHLRHHHKGVFVGAEVGIVKHGVGIENAHKTHIVEV